MISVSNQIKFEKINSMITLFEVEEIVGQHNVL